MTKRNVLLIGAGVDQIPMIHRALKLGLGVIGLDGRAEAEGAEYCDHFEQYDIKDPDAVEEVALRLNKKLGIDGVICPATELGPSAGRVVDKLGLLGIGEETALKMTDKILRRVALDEAKIPQPKWCYREEKKTGEWKIFPCVVKPRDKAAAVGVRLARNMYEVGLNYDYIESFFEPPNWQVSSEVLIFNNGFFAIHADRNYEGSEKYYPALIENGCSLPTKLPDRMISKINFLIDKLVRTFKLSNCVMKLDLLVKDNIVYVIEAAPRLGGGKLSSHMIPMAFGIDYWTLALKVAMGMKIDINETTVKPDKFGTWCVQRYKFPDKVESHRDRLFGVECEGATYEEALKKCEKRLAS